MSEEPITATQQRNTHNARRNNSHRKSRCPGGFSVSARIGFRDRTHRPRPGRGLVRISLGKSLERLHQMIVRVVGFIHGQRERFLRFRLERYRFFRSAKWIRVLRGVSNNFLFRSLDTCC